LTAFDRMHRSWCWDVWLFISGTLFQCGFQFFDVDRRKPRGRLPSRWEPSRRKPDLRAPPIANQFLVALAHSTSHENEVQHQHERKNVREPADVATAESLDDPVNNKVNTRQR
jgi:hypothetical protein